MNASLHRIRTALGRGQTRTRWELMAVLLLGIASLAACAAGQDDEHAASTSPSGSASGGGVSANASYGEAGSPGMVMPGAAPAPMDPRPTGDMEESAADGDAGGALAPAGQSSPGLQSTLGRTIIRNGSMDLEVESVGDAFEQVRQIAESTGGYVADSTFTGRGDSQRAYLTMRIPADQFGSVIQRLRELAIEVNTESTSSQDVTEEYTDLEAQLRNQRAVEEQYLRLLGDARQIGDILQVQDRLTYTRYEIERIQGRLNLLDSLASLATLEVALSPEGEGISQAGDPGFTERVAEAWDESLSTLAGIGTGIVLALVWGWWLIPLAVMALIMVRVLAGRWAARRAAADRVDTPDGAA